MPDTRKDEPARQDPARNSGLKPQAGQRDPPTDSALILEGIRGLHDRMDDLERRMTPAEDPGKVADPHNVADPRNVADPHNVADPRRVRDPGFTPAWRRPTQGEARWEVTVAVAIAVALQLPVPGRLVLVSPAWVLPALEGLLLIGLVTANPRRINRESKAVRLASLTLAAILSLANAWSVGSLVVGLVRGTEGNTAGPLLVTGGVVWLTNVIIFGLWYWEFDRGGPVSRANADRMYPDFQFAQMASPGLAPPHWEPTFGDYLYLSFTNAAAFSPTDVLPLSRWAKMAMAAQASISIVTVALVVARAVNILR